MTIHLFLQAFALILFVLAGLSPSPVSIPEAHRSRFIAFGLFFWLLSTLISK